MENKDSLQPFRTLTDELFQHASAGKPAGPGPQVEPYWYDTMLAQESPNRASTLAAGVPDLRGRLGWLCSRIHGVFFPEMR